MSTSIGDKYTVLGEGRPGRLGTWHTVSTVDGKRRGGLRLEDQRLTDAAAARRLADSVRAVNGLRLPGLLSVIDQVVDSGRTWLITNAAPSPTVAQALAAGTALDPAVAALIATDTAQTLLRLHQAQQAHGDVSPESVVLSASGAALLAEPGWSHAVAGTAAGPGHDAAGWARLLNRLADSCAHADTQHVLRQAAQQVEAVGGSAGLTAALTGLSADTHRVPGFGDRAGVKALATRLQPAVPRPVSAPPAPAPPPQPPAAPVSAAPHAPVSDDTVPAFPATAPAFPAPAPAFPPGVTPTGEETVQLAEGSHSGPPVVPAQAPPGQRPAPPTAVMPAVAPDGATRLGSRAAEDQRKSGAYQQGRAVPPGPQQDVNLRFGQGVPPAPPAWQIAAAQAAPQRPRKKSFTKRLMAFLSALTTVVLLVIAGYVAWNWWQERTNAVKVVKIAVTAVQPPTTVCDVQVDVVGTIETDGSAGIVTYEWLRSDGQSSGALEQAIKKGERTTQVHLYWRFKGQGSLNATATLRILRPQVLEASTKFTYACK
ncbi:hypothetical protein [Catellatospora sp. NPDC049609]|uniref:hypothetical protein n=1 Tax=Catellatospora sp. NPDC049609 TaxID=3155505 RepID=UPI0034387DA3